ncbi:MAG: EboA domain-containing protein [Planctomycetota bacterium]|jgi:hypothetical protein
MPDPSRELTAGLAADAANWLATAKSELAGNPMKILPELFPQLPRRLLREPVGTGHHQAEDITVDLGAWRRCDAAALLLIRTADAAGDRPVDLVDLFRHGDMEERTMVLRCLSCLPIGAATVELLGEAQRTNTVPHFEAAVCDSNLLARVLAAGNNSFGREDFNRMILKMAFIDLPLARVFDAEVHANEELSRMLQGLATEREAAGRVVWRDTNRVIARAPTDGTLARLAGGLEHGDDGTRLAAAEGLAHIHDEPRNEQLIEQLIAFARERLDREPRAAIRDALRRAMRKQG